MSPNYNLGYGSKKIGSAPSRKSRGKRFFILLLLALIAGGVWFILFRKKPETSSVSTPVVDTPSVQTAKPEAQTNTTATITAKVSEKEPETIDEALGNIDSPTNSIKVFPQADALTAEAEKLFQEKQYPQALEKARKALSLISNPESTSWIRAAKALSDTNIKLLTTDCPLPGKKVRHSVKSGDALGKLAYQYNTTVTAIQKANGIPPTSNNIRIGQTLYIYHGDWNIKVSKKDFRLYLNDGKQLFKVYYVGLGRQNRTPIGHFMISSRTKEPDWYSPTGEKIPFGDKRNVLGTRWLRLTSTDDANRNLHGYGIHGTWDRESIGKSRSNGCIRMLNEEVEELYMIVPLKTPVTIEEK